MNTYIEINKEFIDFSIFSRDLDKVYVELNEEGKSIREVGVNFQGEVIHAYPSSKFKYGEYGMLDLAKIDLAEIDVTISKDKFEEIWGLV